VGTVGAAVWSQDSGEQWKQSMQKSDF